MSTGTVTARDGSNFPSAANITASRAEESPGAARFRHLERLRDMISAGEYEVDSGLVADSILKVVGLSL